MQTYNEILDKLIDASGGKEYCLTQILTETVYNQFVKSFYKEHEKMILEKIEEQFYTDGTIFDEKNMINVEINRTCWNKYIMKIYVYDRVNFKLFVYYVKTEKVENVQLFDDNTCVFARSFYPKLKDNNILWEEYERYINRDEIELEKKQFIQDSELFLKKINNLKHINNETFKTLNQNKAENQQRDGCIRYLSNNIFYYYFTSIDGYLTFEDTDDLLLNKGFARLFHTKILGNIKKQ